MTDWNSELERLRGAYAESTITGYRNDFRLFSQCCEEEGHAALPTSPQTIVAYLDAHIQSLKAATLTRRVVAILRIHRLLALPDPTGHEDVRLALRRIKRFRPGRPRQAHGITRGLRQKMLAACGDDLAGKRDRAKRGCHGRSRFRVANAARPRSGAAPQPDHWRTCAKVIWRTFCDRRRNI